MVQALHKADIRVILDVVYNHTYDIENSNFQKTFPDYYYRKTDEGEYSNGSGCGNETASDRPMMRRFMIESVKYWINEYHIDGFRFDLMAIHDIETMNLLAKTLHDYDKNIVIYGEPWTGGTSELPASKQAIQANADDFVGYGQFNDQLRQGRIYQSVWYGLCQSWTDAGYLPVLHQRSAA